MRRSMPGSIAAYIGAAAVSLTIASLAIAQAPAPPAPVMPPLLPPTHTVDLMTQDGITAFGTQWRISDVKIVEVPAIKDAMPNAMFDVELANGHHVLAHVSCRLSERASDSRSQPATRARPAKA